MSSSSEEYAEKVAEIELEKLDWSPRFHCGQCFREFVKEVLTAAMAEERKACKEIADTVKDALKQWEDIHIAETIARRIEMRGESDE